MDYQMDKPDFIELLYKQQQCTDCRVPSRPDCERFIDELRVFLFPEAYKLRTTKQLMDIAYERLKLELMSLLQPVNKLLNTGIHELTEQFFSSIPGIYENLLEDAEAFIQSDPAATCPEEIIMAYPGFKAIIVYRIAHRMALLNIPLIPRIISEYVHSSTGIDIHPGAEIGQSFFIDHGTGVVIGETSLIGSHVKIYQGVTLGAVSVQKTSANTKRHPTIEDRVVIYSGSTILGGDTVVGHDTVIGGNVWLTVSVQPFSLVYNKSEVTIRDQASIDMPLNFII